jgi:hypothetical protein
MAALACCRILLEHIELPRERLGAEAGCLLGQSIQPLAAGVWLVDLLPGCADRPSPEERLQAQHGASRVFNGVLVGAGEFLERRPVAAAVVDGAQIALVEPIRELVGVALVALALLAAAVADQHAVHARREKVVKPLGLHAFLEGDVDAAAHGGEELEQCLLFGRKDGADNDAPILLAHRSDGRCLIDVQGHILGRAFHESRSWVGSTVVRHLHGTAQGRALKMR